MYNRSSANQKRGGFNGGNRQGFSGGFSNENRNNGNGYERNNGGNYAKNMNYNRGETNQNEYRDTRNSSYGRNFDGPNDRHFSGFNGGNRQGFSGGFSNENRKSNGNDYERNYGGNNMNYNRGETSQNEYGNTRNASSYGQQFDGPNDRYFSPAPRESCRNQGSSNWSRSPSRDGQRASRDPYQGNQFPRSQEYDSNGHVHSDYRGNQNYENNRYHGQGNQGYSNRTPSPVRHQGRYRRSPSPSHGNSQQFQQPRIQPRFGSRSPSPRRGNEQGRSPAQNYSNQGYNSNRPQSRSPVREEYENSQNFVYRGPVVHISDNDMEDVVDTETLISEVRAKLLEDTRREEEETRRLYERNPYARPNPSVFEEMPDFNRVPNYIPRMKEVKRGENNDWMYNVGYETHDDIDLPPPSSLPAEYARPKLTRHICRHNDHNPRLRSGCIFCGKMHRTDQCPIIPDPKDRRKFLEDEGRCLRCLVFHRAVKCPREEQFECEYCEDFNKDEGLHHTAICEEAINKFPDTE